MAEMKAEVRGPGLPERKHRLHGRAVQRHARGRGRRSENVPPRRRPRRRVHPVVQQHHPPRRAAGELPGHAAGVAGVRQVSAIVLRAIKAPEQEARSEMDGTMPLSWNEIRHRAIAFSKEWQQETREGAEAKSFWDARSISRPSRSWATCTTRWRPAATRGTRWSGFWSACCFACLPKTPAFSSVTRSPTTWRIARRRMARTWGFTWRGCSRC